MKPSGKSGAPRGAAWNFATGRLQTQKKESQDTFYSPAEAGIMPAPSSNKPEERQFVVDSGASMHMSRKKELSSGELDTPRDREPP